MKFESFFVQIQLVSLGLGYSANQLHLYNIDMLQLGNRWKPTKQKLNLCNKRGLVIPGTLVNHFVHYYVKLFFAGFGLSNTTGKYFILLRFLS